MALLLGGACANVASPTVDYGNIDLAIEALVKAVKSEPLPLRREEMAGQIPKICGYGGASHISKKGIDAIASLLEDDDPSVQVPAAASLGIIGSPAKYTIPLLQKAITREQEDHPEWKTQAFSSGWNLEGELSPIIAKLSQ